jgi:hypothetical protein
VDQLAHTGYAIRKDVLAGERLSLFLALSPCGSHAARNLLWERAEVAAALSESGVDAIAGEALGGPAFPINALFLDKTADANWKVPGHQDLMMPVEREVPTPGFSGWSTKAGVVHVEPPADVLEKLVAVRIHLDPCPASNGALAVVPGSHRRGKLRDKELAGIAPEEFVVCEADAGDLLLMKPLLVHRSSPAVAPGHRRVLHVVFASEEPGDALRWKRSLR